MIPYGRREVSTLTQATQALILLGLDPPGYLLIWILWLKENSEAGDNGGIFCRTRWFIQIICTRAGEKLIALGQCVFHCQDRQPKSNCLLQPKMDTMGPWEKFNYVAVVHRRNVWVSICEAYKSMQLWGRSSNSCSWCRLAVKYLCVEKKWKNKNIYQYFEM